MKIETKALLQHFFYLAVFILGRFLPLPAQIARDSVAAVTNHTQTGKDLFDTDNVMQITLRGDIRRILNDRSDNPQYHSITLLYGVPDNNPASLAVTIKTRGHFRKMKENCTYPPLLIHFSKSDTLDSSVFHDCNKLKLVMPCRGEEYVIREWLIYKLYNLVTPESFRARLVRVGFDDIRTGKNSDPFYAILLEEEDQMAGKNKAISISRKLKPQQTDTTHFLKMAVFQYLIGNTDWSVEYLQNIKLILTDSNSRPIAVPYDFDHAGLVNAPYALPAEELQLRSILERRYRGYCIHDMKVFDETIAFYNRLKKDIYHVFTSCSLLNARYIKSTEKFLDEFYATINNSKSLQREFGYPCNINGTGNVIIKGLRGH